MSATGSPFFVEVDGASLWTIAFGPPGAPAIVCVGGWTGSSELWLGPIGHLSARFRCVTYDHRGTGVTMSKPSSITHIRLVDDVFAVMDAHGIERAVLAAESAGAGVVLGAAVQRPQRVSGLLPVDASMPEVPPNDDNGFVRALRADYDATIAAFVDSCVPPPIPEAIRAWGRRILARSSAEHAIALLRADVPEPPLDLRAVAVPVLLIHCAGDAIAPIATARNLAASLPNATLHELDGDEHVPTITRPAEIARLIGPWLDSLG